MSHSPYVEPPRHDPYQASLMAILNKLVDVSVSRPEPRPYAPQYPKANPPEDFSGDPKKLEGFIMQSMNVMEVQPGNFPNDIVKINYMISFLRDGPLKAIQALKTSPYPAPALSSFASFLSYLRLNYGEPDARASAKRSLAELVQTSSAAKFFSDFRQLMAIVGYDLDAEYIIDQARDKLKPELKDELARISTVFTSFAEFQAFICQLDNRLWARKREKEAAHKKETKPSPVSPSGAAVASVPRGATVAVASSASPAAPAVTPSSTSAFRPAPTASVPNGSLPRGPLTEQEKQRRTEAGLCRYCGLPGHIAVNCPAALKRNAAQGASIPTITITQPTPSVAK